MNRVVLFRAFAMGMLVASVWPPKASAQTVKCDVSNTVVADVAAIDMPMVFNRLGAQNVNWQMYALTHDLVMRESPGQAVRSLPVLDARSRKGLLGKVTLRPDLRPRPLVLRVSAGECLRVNFTNFLGKVSNPFEAHKPEPDLLPPGHPMDQRSRDANMDIDDQVASRVAGFHPNGLELADAIGSDASSAGGNASGLVAPGGFRTYLFKAPKEGSFLVTNPGAAFGGEGTAGSSGTGLFGAVAVQPKKSRFYRGQVTEEEMRLATRRMDDAALSGQPVKACPQTPELACTQGGQPIIDYEATYPATSPWTEEGKAGRPVLNMLQVVGGERRLVHGDINAVIVGSLKDGHFPKDTYPLESQGLRNPTLPNRLEPFREFVSVYHDENAAAQAFPGLFDHPVLGHTLHGVRDAFMINYGSAGVGSEVIANRLGVGPMHDCVDCAFEEFFLSSFTVGDPALLVDVPANLGLEQLVPGDVKAPDLIGLTEEHVQKYVDERGGEVGGIPLLGPKANTSYYPHDPANVHHSYLGDFVKFRNLHTGKEQHIFHLHNHQWLFNPNDDNSNYIDAQAIGPGSGYTYEIAFGGSGNRNKSAGDAVFHCHFYPHFAQGMWYLWRIHDTFEKGTRLAVSESRDGFHEKPFGLADGKPAKGARALPDGELVSGTPIPALVPLPGKGLALMPAEVTVVENPRKSVTNGRPVGSLAKVLDRQSNPGYPFWVAGIETTVGSRPPTPPLDMDPGVGGFDGGLPRHTVAGLSAGSVAEGTFTRLNASKHEKAVMPVYFPETGTDLEKVAMKFHAQTGHGTQRVLPTGQVLPATFETNGAEPTPGAPFFDPCIDDRRKRLTAQGPGMFFGSSNLEVSGQSPFNGDTPRIYKGANIQLDVTFNKLGDHFPQQRILTLWEDVDSTLLTSFKPRNSADVKPRAPEPMVLRMNTFDCARYLHTNLVPKEYELDDYQVKTPTDIIGQHIHLPKWDLPSADGSANGWNYEDGTFSPGMVRSRIHAINAWNQAAGVAAVPNPYAPGQPAHNAASPAVASSDELVPRTHYFFGREGAFQLASCDKLWLEKGYEAFHNLDESGLSLPGSCDWLGARTTIQRWFSDPIVNKELKHRGLGITFTHDHLGPSTHQQVGLYATMLTEPPGSKWVHNETGELLYDRDAVACNDLDPNTWNGRRCDGGPTSWQAVIHTVDDKEHEAHREFFLQFGDFQHAYRKDVYAGVNRQGIAAAPTEQSFRDAITPSFRKPASPNFPDVIALEPRCPGEGESFSMKKTLPDGSVESSVAAVMPASVPRPCPEIISADDVGTMVVNYRQEPLAARVFNPSTKKQSAGNAGDLAHAFETRTDRAVVELNSVRGAAPYDPLTHDVRQGDPFTPILRAYSGDLVRIKIQAGSHEHEHNGAINGLKWLQAGSGYGQAPHSGWRGAQNIGLSEQFTLSTRITDHFEDGNRNATDRLYAIDTSQDGLWNGVWGVIRTLQRRSPEPDKKPMERDDQDQLALVPNRQSPDKPPRPTVLGPVDEKMLGNDCPADAPLRQYQLVAGLANRLLPAVPGVTLPSSRGLNSQGGTLVYNPRRTEVTLNVFHEEDDPSTPLVNETGTLKETRHFGFGPLHDPTAILIVRKGDIDPVTRQIKAGAPVEPVVLRAAAGDCVQVTLENWLPSVWQGPMPDLPGFTTLGMLQPREKGSAGSQFTSFNNNHVRPSRQIGLHPQMLHYDVQSFDGSVVGLNRKSTIGPGEVILYKWYAGGLQYASQPASADMCLSAPNASRGLEVLNELRDQLKLTDDGLRLLRPPNHLFTPEVLANRLQNLLSPAPVEDPEPASVQARGLQPVLPRQLRPLVIDRPLLERLPPLSRSAIANLRIGVPAPAGTDQGTFDGLVGKLTSRLLALPQVQACFDNPVPDQAQRQLLSDEALSAVKDVGDPLLTRLAANGAESAVVYPAESAFSRLEVLRKRIECAKVTRQPLRDAIRDVLNGSNIDPERQIRLADQLSQSMAFLVPGLDQDAFGSREYEAAFRWYTVRDRGARLDERTTRVVLPNKDGNVCHFAGIEFGGTNLSPPDRIKQGQKAAVGAMVVMPEGSFWWENSEDQALDRQTLGATRRARATASAIYPAKPGPGPGRGSDWHFFRDLASVHQKGLNMRYGQYPANGHHGAVGALSAERETAETPPMDRIAPEDAHDAGQMAINYGSEPMWFRFGIEPSAPFGHGASESNPLSRGNGLGGFAFGYQAFANACCSSNAQQPSNSATPNVGDPYTPIFKVPPGAESRIRVLMPTGVGRASTLALHGHGWQRDPYLAQKTSTLVGWGGQHLPAAAPPQYGVPSKCIGANALGMGMGSQDSVAPMAHFDWVLASAGGAAGIPGDFLMRDIGGYGVTSGLWSLMRVQGDPVGAALRRGLRTQCE